MFINNFVGGQRQKRSSSSVLNIEQGENESLRTFISRFNREALLVDEMDDKILLAAFSMELVQTCSFISYTTRSLRR